MMHRVLVSLGVVAVVVGAVGAAHASGESRCRAARDRSAGVRTAVITAQAEFDTGVGRAVGLSNKFCEFRKPQQFDTIELFQIGLIDLQTLTSKNPSIAATYLSRGLDLDELMKVVPEGFEGNPATLYCQALAGSSITQYANGGFATREGLDEICVFGDGSKISTWVLVYVSDEPDYLSMRKAVQSEPLALDLPYLKP